jgi:hypothetical protein
MSRLTGQQIHDVVSKLTFLSKVEKNERIDVRTFWVVQDNLLSKVYRTLFTRGESRYTTFDFILRLMDDAYNIIDTALKNMDNENCQHHLKLVNIIIDAIQESKKGIENLKLTYMNDRMYISKLDSLMKTNETKMLDIRDKIAKLNE